MTAALAEKSGSRRASWFVFTGILLLFSGVLMSTAFIRQWELDGGVQGWDRMTVYFDESADSPGPTLRECERLAERWEGPAGCSASVSTTVVHDGHTVAAELVGVSAGAKEFLPWQMTAGSPIGDASVADRSRAAVIGEDAADRLFGSREVVGVTLRLGGEPFRIVGVYEVPDTLLRSMTDDGRPDIYIPISVFLDQNPDVPIRKVLLSAGPADLINGEGKVRQAMDGIGKPASSYIFIHDMREHRWISQKPHVVAWFCGMLAIIGVLRLMMRRIKNVADLMVVQLRTYRAAEAVRGNWQTLVMGTATLLLLAACIGFLWRMMSFTLYISPDWLPESWIDWSFFADLIEKGWTQQMVSAGDLSASGQWSRVRVNQLTTGIGFVSVLAGLPLTLLGTKGWAAAGWRKERMITVMGLLFPASMLILALTAREMNLSFFVLPAPTAVVCGWLVFHVLNRKKTKSTEEIQNEPFQQNSVSIERADSVGDAGVDRL